MISWALRDICPRFISTFPLKVAVPELLSILSFSELASIIPLFSIKEEPISIFVSAELTDEDPKKQIRTKVNFVRFKFLYDLLNKLIVSHII